jgi:hypothetical protein
MCILPFQLVQHIDEWDVGDIRPTHKTQSLEAEEFSKTTSVAFGFFNLL